MNRVYSVLYYHHRTPQLIEKDVKPLKEGGKFPQHVSVILEMEGMDGIDSLVDEVAEISCWCAAAGIPRLSVYERTGEHTRGRAERSGEEWSSQAKQRGAERRCGHSCHGGPSGTQRNAADRSGSQLIAVDRSGNLTFPSKLHKVPALRITC
jgi:hypothetical protein